MDISKLIEDSDRLFLVSGMVDGIRDSLAASSADSSTAPADQQEYFFQLKAQVVNTLTPEGADALQELFFKDKQGEVISVASLYQHYVALSRFCDLAHQAPRFILSERANEKVMAAMDRKLDSDDPEAAISALSQGEVTLDLSEKDETENHPTGLYL